MRIRLNDLLLLWKQLVTKVTACQLIFKIFIIHIHFGVIYICDLLEKMTCFIREVGPIHSF